MNEFDWIDLKVSQLSFKRLKSKPWSPPVAADFERLATKLGSEVPSEYRYFISKWGGGLLGDEDASVASPILEPCPWGDSVDPETFYPLLQEHTYSLEKMRSVFDSRLPAGVLPIASDAGGNQVCLDVAGQFSGSVWFWDHEQRWFKHNLEAAARELDSSGVDAGRYSVHDIIRGWARLHPETFDRPPDYVGMYRMAPSFADFLHALHRVPYRDTDD